MTKITETIERISIKTTNDGQPSYGLFIKNEWYNSFGRCPFEKGDKVEIEFETNEKGFNNIKTIKLVEDNKPQAPKIPQKIQNPETSMMESFVLESISLTASITQGIDEKLTSKDILEARLRILTELCSNFRGKKAGESRGYAK